MGGVKKERREGEGGSTEAGEGGETFVCVCVWGGGGGGGGRFVLIQELISRAEGGSDPLPFP